MEYKSEKIAIIDADSICFIAHWNSDDKTFNKPLTDILTSTDQIISNILITIGANKYIGFVGFGKDQERTMVYPEYKANRKDKLPLEFIKEIKNHMMNKWGFHGLYGIEADDMVNSVRLKVDNSVICAIDKDLLMLEGTHYNYKKNEWVTVTKEEAALYFWKSMIIGDSVDNIKGLEGKGKVFADNLLINIDDEESMRTIVFEEYVNQYGEYHGISKFYQNYICLKIKDDYPALSFIDPLEIDVNNIVI